MSAASVPIQNIYYLLAYAWDHFRPGEEVDVGHSQCPDAHNLLTMLLTGGIQQLATKGMDKGYREFTDTSPRLRGRVDVLASYRRMTHVAGRMICEFDELTADTLPNQILRATCCRLLQSSVQLSTENRKGTRHCLELLADISVARVDSRTFRRVQLHRNNRHYRLLMHVCQLLHDLYLPEEQAGKKRFRNILDQEIVMHRLFEAFVKQFAIRHCPDATVSAMKIRWQGEWDDEAAKVLPGMVTDVTLERATEKTILDCKYYKDAFVTRHNRHRLHSSHLYQLTAYLQNKAKDAGWEAARGILLYPAVNHDLDLSFSLLGHPVEIRSIDLNQDWSVIHDRLLAILS